MNKLFLLAIASAMLFSNIAAAEKLKRSSVDRYSIKDIKIGMSVEEVKAILPELRVVSVGGGEEYFELRTKRPSKVRKGDLVSRYDGMFYHDQLMRIETSEPYDKLDCKQIRDRLHEKYGKREFIRSSKNSNNMLPQKYTVEARLETRTENVGDNVVSKSEVVEIQDSNLSFSFSHQITCYEIEQGVPKYGEGLVQGVLISRTLKDEILEKEAQKREAERKIKQERESNIRKGLDTDEVKL